MDGFEIHLKVNMKSGEKWHYEKHKLTGGWDRVARWMTPGWRGISVLRGTGPFVGERDATRVASSTSNGLSHLSTKRE